MNVNWNQKELVAWLGTDNTPLKTHTTRKSYKTTFRHYSEFTRKTAKQLIDEAEYEVLHASQRERGKVRNQLLNFRTWLIRQGKSPNTAGTYLQSIRSFYTANNFPVKFQRRTIPKVYPKTQRKLLRTEEIKKILSVATKQRDKALIMTMYQSGMDLDTTLNLNYIDFQRTRSLGGRRLLTVVRRKAGHGYRTFLGRDAVLHLEQYLNERKGLKLASPLFTGRGGRRLKKLTVQRMMKRLAIKSGVMTQEEMDYNPINPCGTHALRSSFSKIATSIGINKNIVDYFMGHDTPYSGSYTDQPDSELLKTYIKLEPHLSVSQAQKSAMEKLEEQGRIWGIDLRKVIQQRAREMAETGAGSGGGFMPDVESEVFARECLKEEIKRTLGSSPRGKVQQKIVLEDELPAYLSEGWRYINSLNNGSNKCVIEMA